MAEMPSILVVEDHGLLAAALLRIIRERGGYEVPAVMATAEQALMELPDMNVDLALVDVSLPSMSGIDLVARVRIQFPDLPCLMLSGHNALQYVDRSVRAGASGYILKEDISGILEGIAAVLNGGTYFSSELHWGGTNK